MSGEMVERVARALFVTLRERDVSDLDDLSRVWMDDNYSIDLRELAIAAIAAMREPTAAVARCFCTSYSTYEDDARDNWRDAIDAALADSPATEDKA